MVHRRPPTRLNTGLAGMNMKQFIKSSISISLKNWPALLAFDIVYKIFCFSVLYSIASGLLSLILETAGISYLSAENLFSDFRNPL